MRRIAALLTALALCILGRASAQATDPASLWHDATLYRDEWGVPHVYAQNPRALGYVFGYAQAEDHLEAMLIAYRAVNGRAAELLGEAFAQSDAFSISMGHARLAEAAMQVVDPVTRDLCQGFALGVNAYMADHPEAAPAWADGVRPEDILALWHAFLMSMAPMDLPDLYRRPRAMDSGNAWALAPSRTEDSRTLLVISPHMYFDGPFRWYEAHLVLGEMDVAGVTLYGLPVIVQGHNAVLGWGLTPNWPDSADAFEERVTGPVRNPNDPRVLSFEQEHATALQFMANARPYYVRTENGLDERYAPALINARGPVFDAGGGALYSWRIGGFRDFGGLYQLMEMGRAQNLAMFQEALLLQQIPCFHIVYADRDGNLFYLYNATTGARDIPVEVLEKREKAGRPAINWQTPESALLDETAWASILPPDALPYVLNPPAGYIQACGNPPWTASDDALVRPEDWPTWLIQDSDTYRSQRARRLLRTGTRNFRDMQSMVYDVMAPAAAEMAPLLLSMGDARPEFVTSSHPDLHGALELVRGWNYSADTTQEGMTFYHLWWTILRRQASMPNDAALYAALKANSANAQDLALSAAAEAARTMRNEFDQLNVAWGDIHRIRRGAREEAVAGADSGEPLFLMSDFAFNDGKLYATYGTAYALVVEFTDPPRAVSVATFGSSENPASPHYDDQLDLLLERRFKYTRYAQDDVFRYARSAYGRRVTLFPLGAEGAVVFDTHREIDARLTTRIEAPAPLPDTFAAFTPFIQAACEPAAVPVTLHIELAIPDGLCAQDALDALQLFAYEPGLGWYPLPGQAFDPDALRFRAPHNIPALYAVLGPESARIEMPAPQLTLPTPPEPPPGPQPGEDLPQVWDASGQQPSRKFDFQILAPIREKPGPETGHLAEMPSAPETGARKFRIEPAPAGTAEPAESPTPSEASVEQVTRAPEPALPGTVPPLVPIEEPQPSPVDNGEDSSGGVKLQPVTGPVGDESPASPEKTRKFKLEVVR